MHVHVTVGPYIGAVKTTSFQGKPGYIFLKVKESLTKQEHDHAYHQPQDDSQGDHQSPIKDPGTVG